MSSLWIALFFLSLSWLFTVPVFVPSHWAGTVLIACGVGFSIFALRKTGIDRFDKKYLLFLVPLVISCIFIPFPFNLGPALISAGIVIGYLHGKASFAGMGTILGGIILTAQSAIMPLYFLFASRYHSASALAPVANLLLKILGVETSLSGDTLFVQTSMHLFAINTTWEKLALLSVLHLLVGGAVVMFFASARKRRIALLLLIILIYMLIRYVFLVLMFIDTNNLNLFWVPIATCISLAPLCLILIKFFPLQRVPHLESWKMDKSVWLLGGVAFLCAFSLLSIWGFHDPGSQKQGRILIDEKHSNWEWTTEEYDTRWYGEKSGYNYYSLYSYLNLYYRADRNFEQLTPSLLSNYDILIIKTPTEPFSLDEVESIERFVSNGGGLFLISDHTNVFGMSTYINPIAERFGLHFRYDATYELDSNHLSEYTHPDLMPHPIVQHMPPFLFATSCTLEVPPQADGVIIGYGLKSLHADYSQEHFFPTEREMPEMEYGLFLQAAAVNYGQGRVAAFTDSTVLSNFWMFMPGKPEFVLGTMEWLNRTNSPLNYRLIFLLFGLAMFFLIIYYATKVPRSTATLVILCSALLAAAIASLTCETLDRLNYPLPQPHTDATRVSFEQEHSNYELPILWEGFNSEQQKQFHTFYVWNQRLGYVPSVAPSLEEAMAEGDIVVIINPVQSLTFEEKGCIMDYLEQGGKVLLLDSSANNNSTSNELLEMFGMRIDFAPIGQSVVQYPSNQEVVTTDQACSIYGGDAILSTEKGEVIFSVAREGQGLIAVFSDSHLFSNAQLGGVSSIPNERQLQISELEFWMLQGLMQSQFGGGQ